MKKNSTRFIASVTLSLLCSGTLSLPLHADNSTKTGVQIRESIAQLEAMPSSRLNNMKLAQLKKELANVQSSGAVLPMLAAPQATASVSAAARTPQTIQADIAALEALPASRGNNLKIDQLKKELASAQTAGVTSPMLQGTQQKTMLGTPQGTPTQTLASIYGRDKLLVSFKKDLQKMRTYLVKGDGKDGHFNKIDQLTSDEKLQAYEVAQDIVDKSKELLKSSNNPEEKKALENYNEKAQLYAKELHPLNSPL